ncbi:glycosyltransferase [Microbacterium murale]|uniref:Glycosyltransferase subfamily 4-like N-terminal domain-containing protein n=1 Tax=Microbacterium murale TaxID=1081040 RepID=A0ABQ1RN96_9MICO|nr:glycosyltransferase [Microbacterium murale]GGD75683.1 hypothetical protein GCM10007269_18470 [Microbacterium murale]
MSPRVPGRTGGTGRTSARCEALVFGLVVTLTDLIPPHFRYGYVHRLTRRMFQRTLPKLPAAVSRPVGTLPSTMPAGGEALTCALLTGAMDIGGIGSVVETLAGALPSSGIRVVVLCTDDGVRAARLRSLGIEVVVVDMSTAAPTLQTIAPDVVALHGAPEYLESAAVASRIPLVPVLHNTEIHYSRARWNRFARILSAAAAAVSVSELVREFHVRHVSPALAGRIHVVANAAPPEEAPPQEERRAARHALGEVLRADLEDDIVFVCLARYDSQKNVAGLVSSFLSHVKDPRVRLVVAGDPSDWSEVRRADAIRRSSASASRVTLLSSSDARTLLAAADAFVLDSFFEGWPVAATEAAAVGLPLVLADFGGARELVGAEAGSVLVANPSGSAGGVSDAAVASARRRSQRQPNAAELGAAIDEVADRVRAGIRPSPAPTRALMDAMIAGHADILRHAAASVRDHAAVGADRVEGDRA